MTGPAVLAAPSTGKLVDSFGRSVEDFRISVTDRCNFRCTYCMPDEMEWLHRSKLLTFEEIRRIAAIFVGLGVRTIRLTGGEPTLRKDLPVLVSMLSDLHPDLDLAMTTNGFLLNKQAMPLAKAGLDRINVSCDSLRRERFEEITAVDGLQKVLEGMAAAEAAGFPAVKVNCVVVRGRNEDELVDFARMARDTGRHVRFIEFMPLDGRHAWQRSDVVSKAEIVGAVGKAFALEPVERHRDPASVWRFADGAPGSIGVIPSVTEPFCGSCNRVRVTSDGQLRTCLFAISETDLRALLRRSASNEEIIELLERAVWLKDAGHKIGKEGFQQPDRPMSSIGG